MEVVVKNGRLHMILPGVLIRFPRINLLGNWDCGEINTSLLPEWRALPIGYIRKPLTSFMTFKPGEKPISQNGIEIPGWMGCT